MEWSDLSAVLQKECGLTTERPVVVGVSGGPDSLCLLHLLYTQGYSIVAVHVNHQLRPEAGEEADFVAQYARSLGIRCEVTYVDVPTFAAAEKLSIEESARILRYRCLMKFAAETGAQAVAVAHQANDQIETELMHLLRGSGISGLKGMPYRGYLPVFSSEIPVVRPLLGMWREQIEAYCRHHQIHPRYDASNSDIKYFRNRIRHELIPNLVTYNDRAKQHLWQLARVAGAEDELLEQEAEQALQRFVRHNGSGYFVISEAEFSATAVPLQRRAMRRLIAQLQQNVRDIGFDAIEKGVAFLGEEANAGTAQLLEDVWLSRFAAHEFALYHSNADYSDVFPLLPRQTVTEIKIPGRTPINPHWELVCTLLDQPPLRFDPEETVAYIDLSQCPQAPVLTTAETNERFVGMGEEAHTLKLGDLFTNKKLFRPARSNWPVLRSGDDLLWVVGLKRSSLAQVEPTSSRILRIELHKE